MSNEYELILSNFTSFFFRTETTVIHLYSLYLILIDFLKYFVGKVCFASKLGKIFIIMMIIKDVKVFLNFKLTNL